MFSELKKKEAEIVTLCAEHSVESLYVFGSAAKGEVGASSDIDLLVNFKPEIPLLKFADNFFELHQKLEGLLGKSVDLVSEKSMKNPVFIKEVFSTRIPIYDRQSA